MTPTPRQIPRVFQGKPPKGPSKILKGRFSIASVHFCQVFLLFVCFFTSPSILLAL